MIKSLLITCALALILTSGATQAESEQITLTLPPSSLAQWYKPANKRQVWLHTMFKLRREMQAVKEYALQKNAVGTKKWSSRLAKNYRKIPEMVPEWRNKVRLDWVDKLKTAAQKGNYNQVLRAHKKLEESCNLCHQDFQALAAALYRAPDFSDHQITLQNKTVGYGKFMELLTATVNRIKIATEDLRPKVATRSLKQLNIQLKALGTNCKKCHRDEVPKERILGANTQEILKKLEESIENNKPKQTGRFLGEAAVAICARCHGAHRTLSDLRELISPIKHY